MAASGPGWEVGREKTPQTRAGRAAALRGPGLSTACELLLGRKLARTMGPDGAAFWAQQREGQEPQALPEEPQPGKGGGGWQDR